MSSSFHKNYSLKPGIFVELVSSSSNQPNSMDTTSDLQTFLDANILLALSDVYLSLFPQTKIVGAIAERSLDSLFKTMLCIFEVHGPGNCMYQLFNIYTSVCPIRSLILSDLIQAKREIALRCLPRMFQDWFAPGFNVHPAAVFHMMEV
jgi:hypothetical protein